MSTLTPIQAAKIAQRVYDLREYSLEQLAKRKEPLGYEGLFQTSPNSRLTGKSGGLIAIKQLSGFGYIARGSTDANKNEILIATRGTDTNFDWLSNFNIGMQIGPGGLPVHAGFHDVWKSFASEIKAFLRGADYNLVHCVGHSLGGALATLNADYFSSIGVPVRLYTFGSPRVGGFFFSRSLSDRVGVENMYRVYHRSDPVPMIPPFPFFHVPWGSDGYAITAGPSGLINKEAHSMADSYIPGVGQLTWADLAGTGAVGEGDVAPQSWLDRIGPSGSGVLAYSSWALGMISKALTWLLAKIGQLVAGALGTIVAANMTVLDRLAWMLAQGATLSLEVSRYVGSIIAAIFRFLGRKLVAGASMTLEFIRWVLHMLFDTVASVARRALALMP